MEHTAVIFDTLQYAKRAKEVGFTEAQAEFQAEEIAKTINEQLITKFDATVLLESLKKDLTIRFGLMLFSGLTLLGTTLGMLIACVRG